MLVVGFAIGHLVGQCDAMEMMVDKLEELNGDDGK